MVYIPLIRRNLISMPILDRLGYSFLFETKKVKLYQDSLLIGIIVVCGNLYQDSLLIVKMWESLLFVLLLLLLIEIE